MCFFVRFVGFSLLQDPYDLPVLIFAAFLKGHQHKATPENAKAVFRHDRQAKMKRRRLPNYLSLEIPARLGQFLLHGVDPGVEP